MGKEEIFSKLNIINYKDNLEKILEKKSFSEKAKNLLLSMIYKIEVSCDDYIKIKNLNINKKNIFEEVLDIIKNNCEKIEIIEPNEKKEFTNDKCILTYPNELDLLNEIYNIKSDMFYINNEKYEIFNKSLRFFLKEGYKIDKTEIIRDFDGWSWNVNKIETKKTYINYIYQLLQILLSDKFFKNWAENFNIDNEDYIDLLKISLENKYNKDLSNNIYNEFLKICMCIYINTKNNKEEVKNLKNEKEKLEIELKQIGNKNEYLQKLADAKKEVAKLIKKIDETISDRDLLKNEFDFRNKNLKKENQIFSLSDLQEILEKERKKSIAKLKQYANLMDPKIYFNTKDEIENKLEIINSIDGNLDEFINDFQKIFISALIVKIKKANTKKELSDLIYQFRYYINIPKNDNIKDDEILKEEIKKTSKMLITKACRLKVINIISNNIEENYIIVYDILNTKIINLNEINIEILKDNKNDENKKENKQILLNIYEDTNFDKNIKYDNIFELKIKFNKKIKLFI